MMYKKITSGSVDQYFTQAVNTTNNEFKYLPYNPISSLQDYRFTLSTMQYQIYDNIKWPG